MTPSPKQRAVTMKRNGMDDSLVGAVLGLSADDVRALMYEADPSVQPAPAAITIWVQWDTGSGPIASGQARDIATRREDRVFDALTGESDPTLFDTETYSGGQTLITDPPGVYDQVPVLLTRGLYAITTAIFMSQSGSDDDTGQGNTFSHVIDGDDVVSMGSDQNVHANGKAVMTEQFVVGAPPASLFLRWSNFTGLNQDVGSLSSLITRLSPL